MATSQRIVSLLPSSTEIICALAPALAQLPGWHDLPAVRRGQVYTVDGQAYFNRPGPRIVDSLEILAGLIHPALFGEFLEEHAAAYQSASDALNEGRRHAFSNDDDPLSRHRVGMSEVLYDLSVIGCNGPAVMPLLWPRDCQLGRAHDGASTTDPIPRRIRSPIADT